MPFDDRSSIDHIDIDPDTLEAPPAKKDERALFREDQRNALGVGGDLPSTPWSYVTGKTEKARTRHANRCFSIDRIITSAEYDINAESLDARTEKRGEKTVRLPTRGRSTFKVKLTGRDAGKLTIQVKEVYTTWAIGRSDLGTYTHRSSTATDYNIPPHPGFVMVSGKVRGSSTAFHAPRAWLKWAQPFPAKRSPEIRQTLQVLARQDNEIDEFPAEDERMETRQANVASRTHIYRDSRTRTRSHTGCAREKAKAERIIREQRQGIELYELGTLIGNMMLPGTPDDIDPIDQPPAYDNTADLEALREDLINKTRLLADRMCPKTPHIDKRYRRGKARMWRDITFPKHLATTLAPAKQEAALERAIKLTDTLLLDPDPREWRIEQAYGQLYIEHWLPLLPPIR